MEPGYAAEPKLHGLGSELSQQMSGKIGDKECRILPWSSNMDSGRPCKYFVYKDELDKLTPGTEVKRSESGFELEGSPYELDAIPSAEELFERPIDLLKAPEYQWFRDMLGQVKPIDPSQKQRPWVIVLMGCPGIGKTEFLKNGSAAQYTAVNNDCKDQLKQMTHPDSSCEVDFKNVFFKQLDDIIRFGARTELDALWAKCSSIENPDERFRHYWANKQHLFTRFAVDKPPVTDSNPKPQSHEFLVGAEMVNILTQTESQYSIAMETTGLSPGLVKFGLVAPHYANYNKLVLLHEINDIEKAKKSTHSRLIRELFTRKLHGGEQFGTYLEVIHNKASETYEECKKFGQNKNRELDAASSTEGRWFFHKVQHDWKLTPDVEQRLNFFYQVESLQTELANYSDFDGDVKDAMKQLGLSEDEIASMVSAVETKASGRICFKDVIEWLFART